MTNNYNNGLDKRDGNYSALTPLSFLRRSATIYPNKLAVVDQEVSLSYQELHRRCRAMARALAGLGVGPGDTVAILSPNGCEMLESHYSVPLCRGVLNTLNTRLDAAGLRFILEHGEARVLFYDTEFETLIRDTVAGLERCPILVSIERNGGTSEGLSQYHYGELLLRGADEEAASASGLAAATDLAGPADEWDAISLNYTSGTTGNPKGVVYHHRGAYLAAMSNAMAFDMNARTVYLWTLPMFHCNGWGYTWAITAVGGTHICLRKVETQAVYEKMERYGVSHLCGAPIVLNMLLNDLGKQGKTLSTPAQFALGGAAPPSSVISKARAIGFNITHLYGLTESYGPATLCVPQPEWDALPEPQRALLMARQGVPTHTVTDARVRHLDSDETVPSDGQTLGEIQLRGHTLMKGYLKNAETTDRAFKGGWFNTGDLAVVHPDGYIDIKDRSKDIIISGGENISSLEVEEVLYQHPAVSEAAVVAMSDKKWGEVPCAFVDLIDEGSVTEQELIDFCRGRMARFKAPKKVVIGELPKTSTGKIRKNILRDRLQD